MKTIPNSLHHWFIIHFIADMLFGLPLIFAPGWLLGLFDIPNCEVVMARLVGAALIGIGGISLVARNKSFEVYDTLLSLKIIWSAAATIGLFISYYSIRNIYILLIAWIFIIFAAIWWYYKIRLMNKL